MPDTVTIFLVTGDTAAQGGWYAPTLGIMFSFFMIMMLLQANSGGDDNINRPNHPDRRKGKRK